MIDICVDSLVLYFHSLTKYKLRITQFYSIFNLPGENKLQEITLNWEINFLSVEHFSWRQFTWVNLSYTMLFDWYFLKFAKFVNITYSLAHENFHSYGDVTSLSRKKFLPRLTFLADIHNHKNQLVWRKGGSNGSSQIHLAAARYLALSRFRTGENVNREVFFWRWLTMETRILKLWISYVLWSY